MTLTWAPGGAPTPRLLVVAQCPKPGPRQARPLEGSRSLSRIARWAGLDAPDDLYGVATVVNLLPDHAGTVWPLGQARRRAVDLRAAHPHDRVVLLGGAVRDAFARDDPAIGGSGWYRWRRSEGKWYAVTPHPSGLSRAYNDPDVEAGAATFWRAVLAR